MTDFNDPTSFDLTSQDASQPGEPQIPAELTADLAELVHGAHTPAVPASLDRTIEQAATAHFLPARHLQPWQWGGLAVAASVVIIGGVAFWSLTSNAPGPEHSGIVAKATQQTTADLNSDGSVDVLDALILAKAVDAGDVLLDLTGDGATSAADVEALAARIVTLRSRG